MAVRKTDLYQSIWDSCDALRGGMDASQYKDYVLVLLFVKYVSDKYGSDPRGDLVIPEGGSFADMVAAKGKADIGERIDKILAKLAEANNLTGVIDVTSFNNPDKLGTGKEMVDRLTKLVSIFENPDLDFSKNRADGDDLLGDAYEYLMRHFATQSGKAKGQFYTPAEVSRVLAAVVGVEQASHGKQTIYDPTCGSGSLLLKAHHAARDATGLDLAIYGQEMDNSTAALARMNMFLHDAPTAEIHKGNTLANPHWTEGGRLKTFDFVVANPPFSSKNWRSGFSPEADSFGRFEYGVPPEKNGDYAFLLHILASLKSTGSGAVILPHGVLFRGNVEARIRKALVDRGFIKGIIGLPPNLFYGTGIPACIVVLDKKHADKRTGIFMIDASQGFAKDGAKNRLRERDIHRIVDTFNAQRDVERYARMVPIEEIASEKNDYNLNIPRYIDSSEPVDIHDIEAHLQGGIPERDVDALKPYWDALPGLRDALFVPHDRTGYLNLKVDPELLTDFVERHDAFRALTQSVQDAFNMWRETAREALLAIDRDTKPSRLGAQLSESLLDAFRNVPLIDEYAVYQRFMEYWTETMKDDVSLVSALGWQTSARPIRVTKKGAPAPAIDYTLGTGRNAVRYRSGTLPADILIAEYLQAEKATLDQALHEKESTSASIEELESEHATADGLLSEVINEKGNITKSAVSQRMRDLDEDDEERAVLVRYQTLLDARTQASHAYRKASELLMSKLASIYKGLDDTQTAHLIVEHKWLKAAEAVVTEEYQSLSWRLSKSISALHDRYVSPLPELESVVESLRSRVVKHLESMGF